MHEYLKGNSLEDQRDWNESLTEDIVAYEKRRGDLFDLVNDKTIGSILDMDEDRVIEFAKIALEVDGKGELNTLIGARGQGALQLARELVSYGRQHELDKAA